MTKFLLYAAALVAFSATPAVLWADTIGVEKKCCTRCCVGRGQLTPPVETGKGSCKAHPASCR